MDDRDDPPQPCVSDRAAGKVNIGSAAAAAVSPRPSGSRPCRRPLGPQSKVCPAPGFAASLAPAPAAAPPMKSRDVPVKETASSLPSCGLVCPLPKILSLRIWNIHRARQSGAAGTGRGTEKLRFTYCRLRGLGGGPRILDKLAAEKLAPDAHRDLLDLLRFLQEEEKHPTPIRTNMAKNSSMRRAHRLLRVLLGSLPQLSLPGTLLLFLEVPPVRWSSPFDSGAPCDKPNRNLWLAQP